jgi:hypothetical protein
MAHVSYHALHASRLTGPALAGLINMQMLSSARIVLLNELYSSEAAVSDFPLWSMLLAYNGKGQVSPDKRYLYPSPKSHLFKHTLVPKNTPRHDALPPAQRQPQLSISNELTLAPCYSCLLVLPHWHFTSRQLRRRPPATFEQLCHDLSRRTSVQEAELPTAIKEVHYLRATNKVRHCIDCSIACGAWPPGTLVQGYCVVCVVAMTSRCSTGRSSTISYRRIRIGRST